MPFDLSEDAYRRLGLDAEIPSLGTALYGNEAAVPTPNGNYYRLRLARLGRSVCAATRDDAVCRKCRCNIGSVPGWRWFHSQDLACHFRATALPRRILRLDAIMMTPTGRIRRDSRNQLARQWWDASVRTLTLGAASLLHTKFRQRARALCLTRVPRN